MSRFDFHFPVVDKGVTEGPVDDGGEHFRGSALQAALGREPIQNSCDHPEGDGPVRVVYELQNVPVAQLPGVASLRDAVECTKAQYSRRQGADAIERAYAALQRETVPVLKISDYGTTGLTGSEEDDYSPLSALTRGAGISAGSGGRGGSFGIGASAPRAASDLRTVYYSSLVDGRLVFSGSCRLATFTDREGKHRYRTGLFRDVHDLNTIRYLRDVWPFEQFEPRVETGTDVYIPGFSGEDAPLLGLRSSIIESFLVAICRGELVVEGRFGADSWRLDSSTVEAVIQSDPELERDVSPFLRALSNEPHVKDFPELGRVELYLNGDDRLERKMGTWAMRRPHMRVDTFIHRIAALPYAAVLICEGEKGNVLLRKLEPPQHDKWDEGRDSDGRGVVRRLKEFVKEVLREELSFGVSDEAQVKGLAKYLPAVGTAQFQAEQGTCGVPTPDAGAEEESATRSGAKDQQEIPVNRPTSSTRVTVHGSGDDSGDLGERGRRTGGSSPRENRGQTGLPGGVDPASDGDSRVPSGAIALRSWSGPGCLHLVVQNIADGPLAGFLELVALDAEGAAIGGLDLGLRNVRMISGDSGSLRLSGNEVHGLRLEPNETQHLLVHVGTSGRMRVGVRHG